MTKAIISNNMYYFHYSIAGLTKNMENLNGKNNALTKFYISLLDFDEHTNKFLSIMVQ